MEDARSVPGDGFLEGGVIGRIDVVEFVIERLAPGCVGAVAGAGHATGAGHKTTPTLKTFRRDLERAGIPFEDAEGRTVDRHSLRMTFVSWLGAAGVDPRTAQQLARHSDIRLTTQTYRDVRLLDTKSAIGKRPDPGGQSERQVALATGTDDYAAGPVVPPVVPTGGVGRPEQSSGGTATASRPVMETPKKCRLDTERNDLASADQLGATGLEPATSCSQS